MQAHATLFNQGTDSLGNRLIYDSDLNITWYDYTRSGDTWQNQVNWADALSVTFGGNTYTDWRMPTTVDGPYVYGYDGTTIGGFNITSSEMGHLFYTELGNDGLYDTFGNPTGCPGANNCLTNTGDSSYIRIWTAFHTPTVNLPVFRGESGLPMGLQVIGPFREDQRTLGCAEWIYRALTT